MQISYDILIVYENQNNYIGCNTIFTVFDLERVIRLRYRYLKTIIHP